MSNELKMTTHGRLKQMSEVLASYSAWADEISGHIADLEEKLELKQHLIDRANQILEGRLDATPDTPGDELLDSLEAQLELMTKERNFYLKAATKEPDNTMDFNPDNYDIMTPCSWCDGTGNAKKGSGCPPIATPSDTAGDDERESIGWAVIEEDESMPGRFYWGSYFVGDKQGECLEIFDIPASAHPVGTKIVVLAPHTED